MYSVICYSVSVAGNWL